MFISSTYIWIWQTCLSKKLSVLLVVNYWHRALWYFFTVFLHVCWVAVKSPLSLDIYSIISFYYWLDGQRFMNYIDLMNQLWIWLIFSIDHLFSVSLMFQILLYIFFNLLSSGSHCIYCFSLISLSGNTDYWF